MYKPWVRFCFCRILLFFSKKDRELLHNSKIRGNFALAKREQRLDRDQALG